MARKKNILLIQLGDIGDVVLSFPCIRALKEHFPDAEVHVAVRERAADLLEHCPWADRTIAISTNKRGLPAWIRYQLRFIIRLRRGHFSHVFDLRQDSRGGILAILSGARHRLGFHAGDKRVWRNRLFTDLFRPRYQPDDHMVDRLLQLLETHGITTRFRQPQFVFSPRAVAAAKQLLAAKKTAANRPIIALQPFSLWQYKELPEEGYVELINRIQRQYRVTVVVTGTAAERQRAASIVRQCGDHVHNLAGKTSLSTYAALLSLCHLFIGVDSAGQHLAAAAGTSTVVLYGPSKPEIWAPRGNTHLVVQKAMHCVPCSRKGCDDSEKSLCLETLSVDEIMLRLEPELKRILA